jgi:hypothetical protein
MSRQYAGLWSVLVVWARASANRQIRGCRVSFAGLRSEPIRAVRSA